jgi:neurofibromin 1
MYITKVISTFSYSFQGSQNLENAELFVNCLEAMVETCLPGDDLDVQNPYPTSLGINSNLTLSSSMSNLSMASAVHTPAEKSENELTVPSNGQRMRHGSASQVHNKTHGSFKRKTSKKLKPEPGGSSGAATFE